MPVTWSWWLVESPPGSGTYVSVARERVQADAQAASVLSATDPWVRHHWTISDTLDGAGVGPPDPPAGLPTPANTTLTLKVWHLAGQGAIPPMR